MMTTYDATGMLIISVAIREIRRVGYATCRCGNWRREPA
ncbi:Hypothetical protein PFR_JS20-2_2184 [Propionibacterium freudenreichii]|nr:Hypothetical protein PFR_JS20-1_2176 [Propionibacterium freudenreichii]SCQ83410.1 Hypothetical protein PFR_JS20-2_2184 [Propionibacterium freudenreichii]